MKLSDRCAAKGKSFFHRAMVTTDIKFLILLVLRVGRPSSGVCCEVTILHQGIRFHGPNVTLNFCVVGFVIFEIRKIFALYTHNVNLGRACAVSRDPCGGEIHTHVFYSLCNFKEQS